MRHLFTRLLLAFGLAGSSLALIAFASPASAGESEANGCVNGYGEIGSWDLKNPAGDKRPDIGGIVLSEKEVDGRNLFCATTQSGSRTQGDKKPMTIMVGYYNPLLDIYSWPTEQGPTYDSGNYGDYAGGAFTKVPDNRCLAVKGSVIWGGVKYSRTITTSRCY